MHFCPGRSAVVGRTLVSRPSPEVFVWPVSYPVFFFLRFPKNEFYDGRLWGFS